MVDRVSSASALVGLLLVLVTLFTLGASEAFDAEQSRPGGARTGSYRRIAITATGLSLVTLTSLISLAPLTLAILGACCGGDWEPVLALFFIVWLLLIPYWFGNS